MRRIGNADTIADIEFVIDAPGLGDARHSWAVEDVDCTRNRYKFSGPSYEFNIEVIEFGRVQGGLNSWRAVVVTELWQTTDTTTGAKRGIRSTKWMKILNGRASDVAAWMRNRRSRRIDEAIRANPSGRAGAGLNPIDRRGD